ncbi:MAG: glycoside hydrolase family 2 TIM barrel-domain containing protein [Clostridia bacterium]
MRGIDFNNDWKFKLSEELDCNDGKTHFSSWNPWFVGSDRYYVPVKFSEDDSNWRTVRLPHDWSVEFDFDIEKGEGCTGYLLGGVGWYRKHFVTTEEMIDKKIVINFDGIYNRASIYCNGKMIKFHPFGYSPCLVDVTDYLNPLGEDNVINVKVDHSRYADSRWYTGSGIYRKVSMHILPKVNMPVWGVFASTPLVSAEKAIVAVDVEIENSTNREVRVFADVEIVDKDGKVVATTKGERYLEPNQTDVKNTKVSVINPILWDAENPYLYTVKVKTSSMNGEFLQEESEKIGIRSCEFDADKGFLLNGKVTKLYGMCMHHDGGLVGAAVPNDVWRRRLTELKKAGVNAIRTVHNPFSEEFFDLCDELGFLVKAEFFDEWDFGKDKRQNCSDRIKDYITRGYSEFFPQYAESDLKAVVKRDRNHASIILWSLGNEIEWVYPRLEFLSGYCDENGADWGKDLAPNSIEKIRELIKDFPEDEYEIGRTANNLTRWTKELDDTRAITANCVLPSVSYEIGYGDALDVMGFSGRNFVYENFHEKYPHIPILGTEMGPGWNEIRRIEDKDYVGGVFMWSAFPFMGEAIRKGEIRRGLNCGVMDFIGNKRANYYGIKSFCDKDTTIYMITTEAETSLHEKNDAGEVIEKVEGSSINKKVAKPLMRELWDYKAGEEILVEVFSNCDEVTLYVNGEAQNTVAVNSKIDKIGRWIVPYVAGEIKAVGKIGEKVCEYAIKTEGKFAQIKISTDKTAITSDYDSVAHIEVELQDANGTRLMLNDEHVKFNLSGAYINMGVDNGNDWSFQSYQRDDIITFQGRALMIIQGSEKGEIELTAQVGDIVSEPIKITVE